MKEKGCPCQRASIQFHWGPYLTGVFVFVPNFSTKKLDDSSIFQLEIVENAVDVFENDAACFGTKEVDEENGYESQSAEQIKDTMDTERRDQLQNVRHDRAHEPVAAGRDRHGSSSNVHRKDFCRVDPSDRSPGDGEKDHEDRREDQHENSRTGFAIDHFFEQIGSVHFLLRHLTTGDEDGGGNEMADDHGQTTDEQQDSSSQPIEEKESRNRAEEIGAGQNQQGENSVAQNALKNNSTVVEDRVDAGRLLQNVNSDADAEPLEHFPSGEQFSHRQLISFGLNGVGDGVQLGRDVVDLPNSFQTLLRFRSIFLLVQPTRTLRTEENADHQRDRSDENDSIGQSPAQRMILQQ